MSSDLPSTQATRGTLVGPSGEPLANVTVAVVTWDREGAERVELAQTLTGDGGHYEISWEGRGRREHLAVVILDANGDAISVTELGAAGHELGEVHVTVPGETDGASSASTSYVVTGTVSSPSSVALGGLAVQVVDKNVGGDAVLVSGSTDSVGHYSLTAKLSARTLASRHKSAPDLQTQVLQNGVVVASSIVRYHAATSEELDVTLPATVTLPSEYETLTADLLLAYPGSPADLEETASRQDITYLANKSGWDARAVAMASLAVRYSHTAAAAAPAPAPAPASGVVDPAFYYALLRAGRPTDATALHQTPPDLAAAIWQQAIDQNVIPASLAGEISSAQAAFASVAAAGALTAPPPIGPSTLADLLAISLGSVNTAEQQQFAGLLVQYGDDTEALWSQAESLFGASTSSQLQLLGQLAYLTANNAPLIANLYQSHHRQTLSSPADLVTLGYYDATSWQALMTGVTPPADIAGADVAAQQANYAELLAAQVRLAYPTATVGQMAASGAFGPAAASSGAGAFLLANPNFDIGGLPVGQYLAANNVTATTDVVDQVSALQRVYQITPSNAAMAALLSGGVDSAYAVTRHSQSEFVSQYGGALGGADTAVGVYRRAEVVHASTMHVAMHYLAGKKQPAFGAGADSGVILSGGAGSATPTAAQATLDELFGNLDYCQCDDCQSITSAAAYLVDLLDWINVTSPSPGGSNPQSVLLARRPDIAALPLTCDNTNIALPYVDLANEVLEYYVGNTTAAESLTAFGGYNDDGTVSSAELIASPQNDNNGVAQNAYQILKNQFYPPPLPFYRDLELLRLHVARFGISLYELMKALRSSDALERAAASAGDPSPYGWRDILAERLGLSRLEYQLLTDSSLTLTQLYGIGTISTLSSLQEFSRRAGVTYSDIVAILQTRFVNPGSWLVTLLDALNLTWATLETVNAGTVPAPTLATSLPPNLVYSDYGPSGAASVEAWIKANFAVIENLIVIDVAGDPCDTQAMTLQYLDGNPLAELDFVRIIRFIRLWQKLGLTIAQTDDLITALFASTAGPGATAAQQLDSGFTNLLPSAGIAYEAVDLLGLDPAADLDSLLLCWAPIADIGPNSLYAQMFLNPTVLNLDQTFAPDPNGEIFTASPAPTLLAHQPAIMAALNVAAGEFDLITGPAPLGLGYDSTTVLSLEVISQIFSRAWLARTLGLSVLELLSLVAYTAVDPFAPPMVSDGQPVYSPLLDFIIRAQALNAAGLVPVQSLYLLWNTDLSGVSAPSPTLSTALAGSLRAAFVAIESQFSVTGTVTASTAQSLMALVVGATAADVFFGLLQNSYATTVPFGYTQSTLPAAVLAAGNGRIGYDDLAKQLSFSGYLSPTMAAALQAAAAGDATLLAGISALATANAAAVSSFFATYDDPHAPYLQPLFDAYMADSADPGAALTALLSGLLPVLGNLRKQEQGLACATTAAGCDPSFAPALLDVARAIPAANPSAVTATNPHPAGVEDLTAFDQGGLSVKFFLSDNPAAGPDSEQAVAPSLTYDGANPLPAPTSPSPSIAAQWNGYVCATQNGDYNLSFTVDAGATVALSIAGEAVTLVATPGPGTTVWANVSAISLNAGALTAVQITATGISATFSASWQTLGTGWQAIPPQSLYSDVLVGYLHTTFVRFLKATALAGDLSLTAAEIAYLATSAGLSVGGTGWLAGLAVDSPATTADFGGLTQVLDTLVGYANLKAQYSPIGSKTPQLLTTLSDVATGKTAAASELLALTGWDPASLQPLLGRLFGVVTANVPVATSLAAFGALPGLIPNLLRLQSALALVKTCGLSATTLIEAATNDPSPAPAPPAPPVPPVLSDFQSALRSRYTEANWLSVVQPINDSIRELQRDALVAYVLVQSGPAILSTLGITATANRLPTPDDLYNYFLLDVEMEPCMETSRIRLALSSIQLFIERCLRNLEPTVSPADIDATQWEWRKRYRVWQANREVFLWPENWLDPSLRDDQSPFFKTTMSQLLQSDITDAAAVSTYLVYLSNLELVAKLEPCGLYYDSSAQVAHVIARNGGAHRKYYYRRFEIGSWTAWEEVKLNIEDVPVVPYVWNGRLLVFWLQLQIQGNTPVGDIGSNMPQSPPGTSDLASTSVSQLSGSIAGSAPGLAAQKVGAVLCFSEYYNGDWQPTKTSDLRNPVIIATDVNGQYDRTSLFIRPWQPSDASDESLYVQITTDDLPAFYGDAHGYDVWGATWNPSLNGFVVHNTHSPPISWADVGATYLTMPAYVRELQTSSAPSNLTGLYGSLATNHPTPVHPTNLTILTGALPQSIEEAQPDVADQTFMPFFFGDARSVFYVTSSQLWATVREYNGFGLSAAASAATAAYAQIPPVVVAAGPPQPDPPETFNADEVGAAVAAAAVGSGALRAVIGGGSALTFGERSIGVNASTAIPTEPLSSDQEGAR